MFSKIKILLLLSCLILVSTACGVGNAGEDLYNYSAEEPDYSNEEPSAAQPTQAPVFTATPPLLQTQEPTAGEVQPGSTSTPVAVSMDLNTVYAQVVEGLPRGSALFNPPATMRVGEVKLVEVRVVPVTEEEIEEDQEVQATLVAGMGEVDEVLVIPLRVSTVMSARLTGAAFNIKPLKEEEQIRSSDDPYISWVWEVTPQEAGEKNLTLFLSVVVNAEGMGDKTYTTSEIRTVQVQSNLLYSIRQFFGTNWEWVATGLILPALGWIWRRFRIRQAG
ncbi:MAG: hypothetical protein P8Y72_12665 [Anaerolineales bacterium]|jgi:hypothetical protein